jgi:hypothetical protein
MKNKQTLPHIEIYNRLQPVCGNWKACTVPSFVACGHCLYPLSEELLQEAYDEAKEVALSYFYTQKGDNGVIRHVDKICDNCEKPLVVQVKVSVLTEVVI